MSSDPRHFIQTADPQPVAVNSVNVVDAAVWNFGTVRYDRRRRDDGNRWRTHNAPNPFSMAIRASVIAPPSIGAEPDDGDVTWKTTVTVGNWSVRNRERERGWRVQACEQTREDRTDIEDHSPDDICYGRIGNRYFSVGGRNYPLEGIYHFVTQGNSSLVMEFAHAVGFTPLLGRSFTNNGNILAYPVYTHTH